MLALLVPAVCGAEESSVYRWAGHGESLYDLADTGWVVEKDNASVAAAAGAAPGIRQEDLPAGYELCPLEGEELRNAVQALFLDYKEYMTAEGLFFYEE